MAGISAVSSLFEGQLPHRTERALTNWQLPDDEKRVKYESDKYSRLTYHITLSYKFSKFNLKYENETNIQLYSRIFKI